MTQNSAPYANSSIPVYLDSETGMKYRTLNCIECGAVFMDRQGDILYRVGDTTRPEEVAVIAEPIVAQCGNCQQLYSLRIALSVKLEQGGIPLYLQPQSIYISVAEKKTMRYVHCLECGKSFHTISDRISMITDNRVPFDQIHPSSLGPMEAICRFNKCSQTWALMV